MSVISSIRFGEAVDLGELNSRMSAPPEKARVVPVSTTALTDASAIARRMPASMPVRRSNPRPLTGGFSIVMTAISPSWR